MAPELGMGVEAVTTSSTAYMYGLPSTDTLRIDDLLDFSNHDDLFDAAADNNHYHQSHLLFPQPEPAAAAAGNLDSSGPHQNTFSDQLYIPSEEAAELEWLSKFVEESFSDVPFPTSQGDDAAPCSNSHALRTTDPSAVPARARSKRSRAPANALNHAISTWSSPPPPQSSSSKASSSTSSSSSSSDFPPSSSSNSKPGDGRREIGGPSGMGVEGGVRRCTHCSSEKTPQWRTGPLGPKTLCNACGVRYKSGRLVPEYRPAASPTFVLTQHSNSHRKVMELRRQKELLIHHYDPRNSAASVSAAGPGSPSTRPDLLFHDYEVC